MSLPFIEILKADHQDLRQRRHDLEIELGRARPDENKCFGIFRALKAAIIAHAKAEEFALYVLLEEPRGVDEAALQHFAFEGYEEHDLIEFLLKEMSTSEELNRQFLAQVKVLGEMLDRHLGHEEEELFPKISPLLTVELERQMIQAYVQERDLVYAKRTGLKPAISLAPAFPH